MAEESHLLEYSGDECGPCKLMKPIVDKLNEEGLNIQRLEVWHDAENAALMEKYDQGRCGGVPYFYNTKTGKSLCGAQDYETIKAWAQGA